jgi:hypothetical protein
MCNLCLFREKQDVKIDSTIHVTMEINETVVHSFESETVVIVLINAISKQHFMFWYVILLSYPKTNILDYINLNESFQDQP